MTTANHRRSAEAAQFYAELFRSARAGCLRELRRAGCSEEKAEDLFSDVYVKAFDEVDPITRHFEPPQMVNWMKTSCRRLLIDQHRHETVIDRVELTEAVSSGEAGADEVAEDHEAVAMYREAVRSLSKRDRQVLLLSAQGHGPDEIQQLMPGLSSRTYRKLIGRARGQVRATLKKIEDGQLCREVGRALPLYLHGEAPEWEGRRVRAHLERCTTCRRASARIRDRLN